MSIIRITVDDLKSLNACPAGIDEFVADFGNVYEAEWTLEEQLRILKTPMRRWIGWAYRVGLIPLWSMSGANLSEADLSEADLSGANLHEADLSGANLHEADLRGANLHEADLRGANLSWADLSEADLSLADLSWADLSGANLRGANLHEADLREAYLSWANLRGAILDDEQIAPMNKGEEPK